MKTRLLRACAILGMLLFVYGCGADGGGGGDDTNGGTTPTPPTPTAAKLDITAHAFSATAVKAIEALGGTATKL